MITARPLLTTILALATATASAQDVLEYRRDILRPGRGDAVTLVPLDGPIYAQTRDGLPDIRIRDDLSRDVPYALQVGTRTQEVAGREDVTSRVVSLKVIEGEALEVITRLDEGSPEPDGATIHSPLADFERRVHVFGSRDGQAWEPLADGRIFDYSRYMDVREVEMPFLARGHRLFKWVFERESDELHSPFYELARSRVQGEPERRSQLETILRRPFRIDRIAMHHTVSRRVGEEPLSIRVSLEVLGVEVDPRDHVTQIVVAAGRLPLSRLSLTTSSRNFQRQVRVQRPAGGGWSDLGRGSVSLFQIDGFRRESLDLDIAETRADRLRLLIEDGDSPPLDVVGVDGEAVDRRVAFVATAGRSYRLEYGSGALPAPRYDADAVLAALGDARRETAKLSPPTRNPTYRVEFRGGGVDYSTWLFLGLLLMAVVLAWAIILAVRGADKRTMDDFD